MLNVADAEPQAAHRYEAAKLRRAALQDAALLLSFYARVRGADRESLSEMQDWLEHGGAFILENASGEPLCALRWREQAGGWRVDAVATHPDARGQGYGRWLMTKLEALAIRANIPTLTLTLSDPAPEVLRYYQRMGYRAAADGVEDAPAVTPTVTPTVTLQKRVGGTWQYKGRE